MLNTKDTKMSLNQNPQKKPLPHPSQKITHRLGYSHLVAVSCSQLQSVTLFFAVSLSAQSNTLFDFGQAAQI